MKLVKNHHHGVRLKRNSVAAMFAMAAISSSAISTAAELTGTNWPDYHGDYRGWRYTPLDQINKSNIAWDAIGEELS